MVWGALLFISVIVFLYRFAFFRHDDWLILGNAVLHLKDDWRFAFDTTLFYGEQKSDWFFRPLFKYGALAMYEVFGLNYALWLLPLLLLFLFSAWVGKKGVNRLSGSERRAQLFFALLLVAVPLYVGSLLWAGEGLMNCPQVVLVALSIWLFAEAVAKRGKFLVGLALGMSFVCYGLSLGFKESTVFHPLFLLGLAVRAPGPHSLRNRLLFVVPFFIFCGGFLVARLLFMPFNVHYIPSVSLIAVAKPILFIGAFPFTVLAAWVIFSGFGIKGFVARLVSILKVDWIFLPFFALSIAPYFGHGFFSSGWLLIPGFYLLVFLAWRLPLPDVALRPRFTAKVVALTFVIMAVPVLGWMQTVGWWHWNKPQRELLKIVKNAPSTIENIHVYKCANLAYDKSRFERVVAFEASLYYVWAIQHPTRVKIEIHPCDTEHPELFEKSIASTKNLVLRWHFPTIEKLSPHPSFIARAK